MTDSYSDRSVINSSMFFQCLGAFTVTSSTKEPQIRSKTT